VERFLDAPDKPLILALSRADPRKNIASLVRPTGSLRSCRTLANLLIVAGNRDDIRELDEGAAAVLTEVLLQIDAYDLYGRVAVPKHHGPTRSRRSIGWRAPPGGSSSIRPSPSPSA
jgi:sucrose-phosphate synthase